MKDIIDDLIDDLLEAGRYGQRYHDAQMLTSVKQQAKATLNQLMLRERLDTTRSWLAAYRFATGKITESDPFILTMLADIAETEAQLVEAGGEA